MNANQIAKKLREMKTYAERVDYLWGAEVRAMVNRGDISEDEFDMLDSFVECMNDE